MKVRNYKRKKVNVITLGCSKNVVDSEVLMGQLKANKFSVAHETATKSDIVIINTCGFIDKAKQESIDTILQYADEKRLGGIEKLYVTGCLSQRYKDSLEEEIPEVDGYFGTMELPVLLKRLGADYKHELVGERILSTPSHFAYMKISEGCNRTCSFCAIPLMRGQHVSRPIEELVNEATRLVQRGVKEIMLIAQELTYYGLDIYKERALPKLLDELAAVKGLEWIRLHYAYPSKFPMEILDAMNRHANVCKYLDMPLQHAADSVLKAMRRQITRDEMRKLLDDIRAKVPGIAIRTTMLVGFPGETEQDFEDLCDFVREQRFNRLGAFTYSHEEGTSGYALVDDVPEDIKNERAAKLMAIQSEISQELNNERVGEVCRVLIDRKEGGYFIGRTEHDSPEVDNEVLIDAQTNTCKIGEFVNVRITDAAEFDLVGEVVSF